MKKKETKEKKEMKETKEMKKNKIENDKVQKDKERNSEKNEKIMLELEKLKEENSRLKDDYLRKAAEFENYKRRTENEQINLIKYAAENFIMNILPVYNDLERSLLHADDEGNFDSLKQGLTMIFEKFKKVLKDQGVEKIDCVGKPFDFNLHEALMQQPAKDIQPHIVLQEIEPGYMYKDKVLKHSKVIVSQELVEPADTQEKSEDVREEE